MVYNALNQLELLSGEDIAYYRLNEAEPLHWKLLAAGKSTKVGIESEVSYFMERLSTIHICFKDASLL